MEGKKKATFTVRLDDDLRRDMEDLVIQTRAAMQSAAKGHYATAKAELRGAIMALDRLENRRGDPRSADAE